MADWDLEVPLALPRTQLEGYRFPQVGVCSWGRWDPLAQLAQSAQWDLSDPARLDLLDPLAQWDRLDLLGR